MRSEQVHKAIVQVPNRFRLCGAISRATRLLHVAQSRTEDTMGLAITEIASGKFQTELPPAPPVVEPIDIVQI